VARQSIWITFFYGFDEIPKYLSLFNCFQVLMLVFGVVGMIFSPMLGQGDGAGFWTLNLYQNQLKRLQEFRKGGGDLKEAPEDLMLPKYVEFESDCMCIGILHGFSFMALFCIVAPCQVISILIEIAAMYFSTGVKLNINTFMWFTIQGFRVIVFILMYRLIVSFMSHIELSRLGVKRAIPKTFWPEYVACINFCQFMIMLPLAASFDFTKDFEVGFESIFLVIFTALHFYYFIPVVVREWELANRDTEYTDEEYVAFFDKQQDRYAEKKKQILQQLEGLEKLNAQYEEVKKKHGKDDPEGCQLVTTYGDSAILGLLTSSIPMSIAHSTRWNQQLLNLVDEDMETLPTVYDSINFESNKKEN